MAAPKPDPRTIRAFANPKAFEAWLGRNHARASEVWIKIFKKGSGKPSIDASQALDVALCFGWIDGLRLGFDDEAFLQRYTPRTAKSRWSELNVARVKRLLAAGRMTPHGQRQIDAAKADGRWQAAYPSPSAIEVPEDFTKAVTKNKKALAAFLALGRQPRGMIAYRLHHVKSAERRRALIAELVAKLAGAKRPTKRGAP